MLSIYGIYHKSPREVARELMRHNISFTIYGKEYDQIKKIKKNDQPFDIILIDGLDRAKKISSNGMMIVCDSKTALARTNCDRTLYPGFKLNVALEKAIEQTKDKKRQITLRIKDWTLKEILKTATTYSFLNGIQTALYKITPYSLRKESQKAIIAYFYGAIDKNKLNILLESSKKLATLHELCNCEEADRLRLACMESIKDRLHTVEICKKYGFEEFEVVYIIKSYEKEA